MRFSCKSCQATFQTATGAPAVAAFRCPSCGGEMAAVAEVVELWQDRIPTRRYDLDDLRARLDLEREEFARTRGTPRSPDQVWFAAVQGRQVGPLSVAGIAGLRARGQLSAASLVWREGWPSWVAAEAVPELRPILGLPEETLGRPFPVQPKEPAPPPFDSTYAAARAQPSADLFADAQMLPAPSNSPPATMAMPPPPPASALSEKTDPAAHLPDGLDQAFAAERRPAAPGAVARDSDPEHAAASAAEPPIAAAEISPVAAREISPAAASEISPAASELAPAADANGAAPIAIAAADAAHGPPAIPLSIPAPHAAAEIHAAPDPHAPPALPRADELALEQVASAVLGRAHAPSHAPAHAQAPEASATDSSSGNPPSRFDEPTWPRHAPSANGEAFATEAAGNPAAIDRPRDAEAKPEVKLHGETANGAAHSMAAVVSPSGPADPAAAASSDSPAPALAAPSASESELPGGALDPAVHMIDLSAVAPTPGESPPPRRSRPPSTQQWFTAPEEKPEIDPRARLLVLAAALALALVVLGLLIRSH